MNKENRVIIKKKINKVIIFKKVTIINNTTKKIKGNKINNNTLEIDKMKNKVLLIKKKLSLKIIINHLFIHTYKDKEIMIIR